MPPTRMLVITNDAPSIAGVEEPCVVTRADPERHRARSGNHRQALLIRIVERELVDAERRTGEAVHEQRHAHAGAADHGNLHGVFRLQAIRLKTSATQDPRPKPQVPSPKPSSMSAPCGSPSMPPAARVERLPMRTPSRRQSLTSRP